MRTVCARRAWVCQFAEHFSDPLGPESLGWGLGLSLSFVHSYEFIY
jgi:hypothetical protein